MHILRLKNLISFFFFFAFLCLNDLKRNKKKKPLGIDHKDRLPLYIPRGIY